ncbi:hypothetical protein [Streptomyces niveus]|uniref:hypothetical protein n=1 Tax=Streptomyces niveus TaxID=193462 RepID=UPI00344938F7
MALLFDTDFSHPPDSLVHRHLDGRLFTAEEQAILRDATAEELQAVGLHVHSPEAEVEAEVATREMIELILKYAVSHHEALVPFMTHEDLMEYDRLALTIGANADRYAPHED